MNAVCQHGALCAHTADCWENGAPWGCQLECCLARAGSALQQQWANLCPSRAPPPQSEMGCTTILTRLHLQYFRLNQFFLHLIKGCTNTRCLFFRVINLEKQLGIPQNVPKASKNLTGCEIFSSWLLGSLLPSVCKAQHRMSDCSTPTTEAVAEGDPAAALMVPFTEKGFFSSQPASPACKEQGGTSSLA